MNAFVFYRGHVIYPICLDTYDHVGLHSRYFDKRCVHCLDQSKLFDSPSFFRCDEGLSICLGRSCSDYRSKVQFVQLSLF